MRAMQRKLFRAKSAKNNLKPTDFLEHNFYFEMEGVLNNDKSVNSGIRTHAILTNIPCICGWKSIQIIYSGSNIPPYFIKISFYIHGMFVIMEIRIVHNEWGGPTASYR